jgi:drug/metabolite transporter (DMT)-like permease
MSGARRHRRSTITARAAARTGYAEVVRLSSGAILVLVTLGILFGSLGNGLLASAMRRVGPPGAEEGFVGFAARVLREPRFFAGVAFQALFFGTFLLALTSADLSFVLPVTALDHILTPLVAIFVLGERPPTLRWIGIALVAAGVLLVLRTMPYGVPAQE